MLLLMDSWEAHIQVAGIILTYESAAAEDDWKEHIQVAEVIQTVHTVQHMYGWVAGRRISR
jgi:hypothetical protein